MTPPEHQNVNWLKCTDQTGLLSHAGFFVLKIGQLGFGLIATLH